VSHAVSTAKALDGLPTCFSASQLACICCCSLFTNILQEMQKLA